MQEELAGRRQPDIAPANHLGPGDGARGVIEPRLDVVIGVPRGQGARRGAVVLPRARSASGRLRQPVRRHSRCPGQAAAMRRPRSRRRRRRAARRRRIGVAERATCRRRGPAAMLHRRRFSMIPSRGFRGFEVPGSWVPKCSGFGLRSFKVRESSTRTAQPRNFETEKPGIETSETSEPRNFGTSESYGRPLPTCGLQPHCRTGPAIIERLCLSA